MELARWTAHPARSRPRDLALLVAVLLLTAGAVLSAFESLYLTVLAVVILLLGVSQFLFPTRYVLTDEGVEERRLLQTRTRRWSDLRRFQVGPGAALVSPFAEPTWLDRYRGLMLYLDGADRQRVVEILEERVGSGAPA
jgi:hypothetical protein